MIKLLITHKEGELKMSTKQIKLYKLDDTCAAKIIGYYYTEQLFPNGDAEFHRWM